MKNNHRAAGMAASFAVYLAASTVCLAQGSSRHGQTRIPAEPVGVLSAFPTIVQTGTKPTLNWNIMHPSKVSDLALINPPGTIVPNQDVFVSVQPIGTGVTACEPGDYITEYHTDARVSFNGGPYQQIFYGTQADVDPAHKLYTKKVAANQTIDFGGRYVKNNAWTPFFTTRSANMQVISLVHGDHVPTSFPLSQGRVKNYLRPYIDGSGRVNIGPLQVLVLMELGTMNRSDQCFDYQDQALLVTISLRHPNSGGHNNHGHGNNLDGVDVSNPGQGVGGPTGLNNAGLDPSEGFDDEKHAHHQVQ